jgi:1,4-alpha-glucan branching enzyme
VTAFTERTVGAPAALALILAATLLLPSCAGVLSVIEDRLPPPYEVKDGMLFSYQAPSARQVTLAGNFNNWGGTQGGGRYDASIDPMSDEDGDGIWTISVPLPPGRYQYKFVIDGGVRWERDPSNPDTDWEGGIENSLIIVPPGVRYEVERVTGTVIGGGQAAFARDRGEADAEEEAEPVDVTFEFAGDGGQIEVAGEFNNWEPVALTKGEDGVYRITIPILPGTYEYKFVVDGTWIEDPENPETVPDPYGGKNSVLTVE